MARLVKARQLRASQLGLRGPVACSLGVCLCSLRGKKVKRAFASFNEALKAQCPLGGQYRPRLAAGFIVCEISRQGPLVGARMDGGGASGLGDADVFYFHIGLMYFSPYRATFGVVKNVDGDALPGEE